MTPLCFAAYMGHVEVVRLLLAEGADRNAKTTGKFGGVGPGATPLSLAAGKGLSQVAALFKTGP